MKVKKSNRINEHNDKVHEFERNLESTGIEEIDKGKTIYKDSFPKDRQGNEVGDLIVVNRKKGKLVVYVIEFTLSRRSKKINHDRKKLRKSKEFFEHSGKARFFFENNLGIKEGIIRYDAKGFLLSYRLVKFLNETPDVEEVFHIEGAC